MKELALFGGEPANPEPLTPANHIGTAEARAAWNVITKKTLSGFLGGHPYGGEKVTDLEARWAEKFKVRHAIACNSATSGLLASCVALGVENSCRVIVPTLTMSATAAAPKFLGATIEFADCDDDYFQMAESIYHDRDIYQPVSAVIVTNLFGHPANLRAIKRLCERLGTPLIEDNAQSILAKEGEHYAGTVGEIGVYSLNVHKAIQAGEGGVCVTDNDRLADCLRGCINHGELRGLSVGLNLRMTEVTAAIAIEQLKKLDEITALNIQQANDLSRIARKYPWLRPPLVRGNCSHVYYCWAVKIEPRALDRDLFVQAMLAEGFPLIGGYGPVHLLPAFDGAPGLCPVAERLHHEELVLFENTLSWFSSKQLEQFDLALSKIDHHIAKLRTA